MQAEADNNQSWSRECWISREVNMDKQLIQEAMIPYMKILISYGTWIALVFERRTRSLKLLKRMLVSKVEDILSTYLVWHHKLLPDNYKNSVARLSSQVKQLRRDPEVLRGYNSITEDQLRSGIIERVDTTECPAVGKVHYLPHHREV